MSKLSQFTGKPKVYVVGGVELELRPRTMKDLDIIMALADESKQSEAFLQLIKVTLQEAVPDATQDEIDNMGLAHFKELSEAILDVNGLKNVRV